MDAASSSSGGDGSPCHSERLLRGSCLNRPPICFPTYYEPCDYPATLTPLQCVSLLFMRPVTTLRRSPPSDDGLLQLGQLVFQLLPKRLDRSVHLGTNLGDGEALRECRGGGLPEMGRAKRAEPERRRGGREDGALKRQLLNTAARLSLPGWVGWGDGSMCLRCCQSEVLLSGWHSRPVLAPAR